MIFTAAPSLQHLIKTSSYRVALSGLEGAVQTTVALKSQSPACFCLPGAEMKGMHSTAGPFYLFVSPQYLKGRFAYKTDVKDLKGAGFSYLPLPSGWILISASAVGSATTVKPPGKSGLH